VYNTDRKSKHAAQGNANLPAGLIDLAHPSKDGREHPPMSFMRRFQESVLCMVYHPKISSYSGLCSLLICI